MGDENHIRTLGDYSKPSHEGYRNTIELPTGNNVVPLQSDTIRLVQNGCSFHGLWSEDPNQHLKDFLKLVDSLDLDGENREKNMPANQIKPEKSLLDFDSNKEERLSHLRTQLEQQQDYMIRKINLLWKTVSEILNDTSPPKNTGNSIAPKSITAISHDEKEELRKKGIKRPSKLLSPKYLSPASIEELNKNPLSPKRVHFVNLIVMLSIDSNTKEEDDSSTNACNLNLGGMVKVNEEVKEKGKDEDEMETIMEVEEVFEEEESEFETEQEIEEIFEDEEDDVDDENFNSFPTIKELSHHEWLLNNPRPPWVKAK
ncbi:hypothetical protein Tco_0620196 [Tanacetum coccineum]